jgi:hypothetical protein
VSTAHSPAASADGCVRRGCPLKPHGGRNMMIYEKEAADDTLPEWESASHLVGVPPGGSWNPNAFPIPPCGRPMSSPSTLCESLSF